MSNYIATWFYAEQKGDESFYPQVSQYKSFSPKFHLVYLKCVITFFYSFYKFRERGDKYLFFTNLESLPDKIGKIDVKKFFEERNIEVVRLDLSFKTPADWYNSWRNQFYLFDILNYVGKNFTPADNFLILDSDCIATKSPKSLFDDVAKHGLLNYDMRYPEDYNINGVTKADLKDLFEHFYGSRDDGLYYSGGEFFAATYNTIKALNSELPGLLEKNYGLYKAGKKKLNEEAHVLTTLYSRLKLNNGLGNKYIKRLWTFNCVSVEKGDENLPIWHLPVEKNYGLNDLLDAIEKDDGMSDSKFLKLASLYLGVPKFTFYMYWRRFLKKAASHILKKIKK